MDRSTYKTLKTAGGFTYSYYAKPASPGKTTLLFCHGFPDSSQGWRFVAPHFEKLGYGVVVPDLLGAGGTDAPLDEEAYVSKSMAASLISILDEEKVDKVVSVGHDHGARMASMFTLWHPDRVEKLALVSVGYYPPTEFNLENTNAMTKQMLGYETFGYWPFLIDDAQLLMEPDAAESWFYLLYPENAEVWRDWLCPLGKAKEWVLARKTSTLAPWVTDEDKQEILNKNYPAQTRWYSVNTNNTNWKVEQSIPKEDTILKLPVLMVNAARDYPCNPKINEFTMPSLCTDLTMVTVDSDHWVMRWVPEQLCEELEKFITK